MSQNSGGLVVGTCFLMTFNRIIVVTTTSTRIAQSAMRLALIFGGLLATVSGFAPTNRAPAHVRATEMSSSAFLFDPSERDAKYGANTAQYLVDLHDTKTAFNFCGGMMFQVTTMISLWWLPTRLVVGESGKRRVNYGARAAAARARLSSRGLLLGRHFYPPRAHPPLRSFLCDVMMYQLVLTEKLRSHLGAVAAASADDADASSAAAQQPVVFDAATRRMAQTPGYAQSAAADNARVFHGREIRQVTTRERENTRVAFPVGSPDDGCNRNRRMNCATP